MAVTQYIGSRYVPLFADPIEWSASNTYEPLTIVIHEGNSYTSKQAVPKDIDISNEAFWALTGNYNAQVELYRRETALAKATADDAQADIDTLLPKADFSAENTVKKYVDDSVAVVQNDIDTLLPKSSFDVDNTVKDYIDTNDTDILAKTYDNYLIPDMFDGTDTEKLQACFNALVGIGGNIIINRNMSISDIVINNDSDNNVRINVIGIGKNNTLQLSGSFTGREDYNNNGNIAFENIKFNGNNICFNCDRIIRLHFTNCVFENFQYCFFNTSHLMQTMYVDNCLFRGIQNHVIYGSTELYDIKITRCVIEASANFMYGRYVCSLNILNNCIEGLSGYVLKCDYRLRSANISFNYFELNNEYIVLDGTDSTVFACTIFGNFVAQAAITDEGKSFVILPAQVDGVRGQVIIANNNLADSTARFYLVDIPTLPTTVSQLSGVHVFANNWSATVSEFKNGANYMALTNYSLRRGVTYESVVVFSSDGAYSNSINIPMKSTTTIEIATVTVPNVGVRDASLYSTIYRRDTGFSITPQGAEQQIVAGRAAVIGFKVMV